MQVLKGERVIVRQTEQADLPDLLTLWNNGEVMQWVGFPTGIGATLDDLTTWLQKIDSDARTHHFVVHAATIGFCGEVFYEVDAAHRQAGLDIKLLPTAQGQGLAADALRTLIAHIFTCEAEVDGVWTEPSASNRKAQSLYRACGLHPVERPADMPPVPSYWERCREDWEAIPPAGE